MFAETGVMPGQKTLESPLEVMQETPECTVSRISALSGDEITVPLLDRITSSTVLNPSLNSRNSSTPGSRTNREGMPRKLSSIFSRRFCRTSSRRVCSRISAHVTAWMSPRSVAAETASFSSRSADLPGYHVMMASRRQLRGSIGRWSPQKFYLGDIFA